MSDETKRAQPPPRFLVAEQRFARMTWKAPSTERLDSSKATLDSFPHVSVIKMSFGFCSWTRKISSGIFSIMDCALISKHFNEPG
jgi:hypothetical protein